MTLEFDKLADQLRKMGYHLAMRNPTLSDRLQIALQRFDSMTDMDAINERIKLVRQSNISGYRGAAPFDEAITARFADTTPPPSATVVAADGSQIYPDHHSAALYYLTNIGLFVYHFGTDRVPDQITDPQLRYTEAFLKDNIGNLISNVTVNARRSVGEMQALARIAWDLRGETRPLVTLYDGPLLKFFAGGEVVNSWELMRDYQDALRGLYDVQAVLAGYVDSPDSRYVIKLLHLMSLEEEDVNAANLETDGDLEGLEDKYLFNMILRPGERSAIMVQNSPTNRDYSKNYGEHYEIAFFYMNVSDSYKSHIARVDIPIWVARDKHAVDELQALLLDQCSIQGRYPYSLTRADELAVVNGSEKEELNEMIAVELLKNGVSAEISAKLEMKGYARSFRQQHQLRS